jgi:hypothetical protein
MVEVAEPVALDEMLCHVLRGTAYINRNWSFVLVPMSLILLDTLSVSWTFARLR